MNQGYVHVYTGNGKGKSTAAFGMAIRAAMAGKKVYIGQFVKNMAYSETEISTLVTNIEIEQLGDGCFIFEPPTESDKLKAQEALKHCHEKIQSKMYDLIILDEINIALFYKLISEQELIDILSLRPFETEIILTGRYASENLIHHADLVTEMKEIKHYYTKGVLSRKGFDC